MYGHLLDAIIQGLNVEKHEMDLLDENSFESEMATVLEFRYKIYQRKLVQKEEGNNFERQKTVITIKDSES